MSSLSEIEAILRDETSGLRQRIARDVGSFTVALFAVFEQERRLQLAGTGTLVAVANFHYILTASHVWEEVLKSADGVGITLRENTDQRYIIRTAELHPFGPARPEIWNEWGPDLVFLQIPSERVASIEVYKTFYNLTRQRQTEISAGHLEAIVIMGTPAVLGTFTRTYADVEISALFANVNPLRQTHEGYDYLDFDEDLSLPGVPNNFGGVSGGGVWKVLIYSPTEQIEWLKVLEGVAFHQSELANHHRIIRCHGPHSIQHGAPVVPTA